MTFGWVSTLRLGDPQRVRLDDTYNGGRTGLGIG